METNIKNTSFRSQDEIVARIECIKGGDFFGFKTSGLISYLDYEHAKIYLNQKVTPEDWRESPSERESIIEEMKEYMEFAWDKANNERGISAGRSLAHFAVWVWMIGDQDLFGDLENYEYYGKDHLRKLCDTYGWDADKWDDGRRVN